MSEKYEILKTIDDLARYHFIVPSYQRGYRWGEKEIRELLEDIWDFAEAGKHEQNSESFYCLQPIVVRSVEGEWDEDAERRFDENSCSLIDGQQRLTTIFLILKFLGGDNGEDYFSLKYKTRKDSGEFLSHINTKELKDIDNMDSYHFYKAYGLIKAFFGDSGVCLGEANREKFKITLLQSCRVLWHEIKEDNEEKVFTRLNIGKIPLLPAENIKALFLAKRGELDDDELRSRAEDWYNSEIEARRRNDFRYAALTRIDRKDVVLIEGEPALKDDVMRIEVYLKAICPEADLFNYFYKRYKTSEWDGEWERLKNCINALNSFTGITTDRNIRKIYHYLGFLTLFEKTNKSKNYRRSVDMIYEFYTIWFQNHAGGKFEIFRDKLLNEIRNRMRDSLTEIKNLSYQDSDGKRALSNILLLFNIAEVINDISHSDNFFEFNRYQLEEWSLEHIYAQHSRSIADFRNEKNIQVDGIKSWLLEVQSFIEKDRESADMILVREIGEVIDNGVFVGIDGLLEKINENFKISSELHTIRNLALLDKRSNIEFGNCIFSQKRKKIDELSTRRRLVPDATRKVFAKAYSKDKHRDLKDVFDKEDRESYFEAIELTIKEMLSEGNYAE